MKKLRAELGRNSCVVADLQGDACVAVGLSHWGTNCGMGRKREAADNIAYSSSFYIYI
jgi:hypothetical protein